MKATTILAAALAATLLGGCTHLDRGGMRPGDPTTCQCTNPRAPLVTVQDDTLTVDQPVIVLPRGSSGPITWTLNTRSAYRFVPERGIVIEGRLLDELIRRQEGRPAVVLDPTQGAITNCRRDETGLRFTCDHRSSGPGVYKYTIRLTNGQRVIELDPVVIEM